MAQGADADAGVVFRALANEMISAGEAEEVSETCQQLMGETHDRRMIDELGALSIRAQQRLKPAPSRLAERCWAASSADKFCPGNTITFFWANSQSSTAGSA